MTTAQAIVAIVSGVFTTVAAVTLAQVLGRSPLGPKIIVAAMVLFGLGVLVADGLGIWP